MSSQCPELVDPERFADQQKSCCGTLRLDQFERVASQLAKDDGSVEYSFHFSRDPHQRPVITGHVEAILWLQCQRCMEPFEFAVDAEIALVKVQGLDEAEELAEEYDPLMPETDRVNLLQLVEDELLLAIPIVPRHSECDMAKRESGEPVEKQEQRRNPFDVLASLKKD